MKKAAVTMQSSSLVLLLLVAVILCHGSDAFSSPLLRNSNNKNARWGLSQQGTVDSRILLSAGQPLVHCGGRGLLVLHEGSTSNEDKSTAPSSTSSATSKSLEEKMKGWEATDEEIRAATLGGVVPQRSDAFDLGLYIAFPIMVATGLFFAFFPLLMGSIDTSSVGPPPTM